MIDLTAKFWETTYKQNIGKMIGICYRYIADRQIAEDLAHDAFLIAIDKSSSFEGKGPFDAWLRRIVVNVAMQYLREQKKKKYLDDWIVYNAPAMETQDDNLTNEETDFSEKELLDAINELPEHHRFVFNLYVLDKFTHAQIGQELGISEGTSKSHLARARKKIRILLSDKLKEGQQEDRRKQAFFLFGLPYNLWNVDRLYQKKFNDFEMQPQKFWSVDSVDFSKVFIPKIKPYVFYSGNYLKVGFAAGTVGTCLFLALHLPKIKLENNGLDSATIPVLSSEKIGAILFDNEDHRELQTTNATQAGFSGFDTGSDETNKSLFSDSSAATIFNNRIILSETINKIENMKKINTLGALLITGLGLTFDSTGQLKRRELPGISIVETTSNSSSLKSMEPDEKLATSTKKTNLNDVSGTFYASTLFWSATDNELYLKGNKVKVNVGENNFLGNGTFTFLNKVYYLVVNGTPAKINTSINLTEGKYFLRRLSPQNAIKKYGEIGQLGAIEISLAE